MPKCSVKKCKNNTLTTLKKDGISYFRFPKNEIERDKWRQIIAKERGEEYFKPNDSSVVCSCHFSESDMYLTKTGLRKLNKLFLPRIESDISVSLPESAAIPANTTVSSLAINPSTSAVTDKEHSVTLQQNTQIEISVPLPAKFTNTTIKSVAIKPSTSAVTENEQSLTVQQHTQKQVIQIPAPLPTNNENHTETMAIRNTPSPTSSGLTSILESPKTSYYKKSLKNCQKTIDLKNKQIQNLKKKNQRLMKRNLSLKEILEDLKKKRFVDESLRTNLSANLNENDKVKDILTARKMVPFAKYPPELRKFALTLHFYSPAAYKYLRDVFARTLPHPNTLFRWYQNIHAQPGFTEEAFSRLTDKVKATSGPLFCGLVVDEMSIRQQKTWTGRKFEGLVDMGIGSDDNDLKATQAFVFVVVSLNQSWTLPIAYFLISSLTEEMKANLISLALQKCQDIGVKILSLTFDGCRTNINCMKSLGCNLDNEGGNLQTTFPHPNGNHRVAVFLDACHMVKLMRNLLEAQKCIYDENDKEIKWELIVALHNLQEENSLHLANKLTLRHIHFRNEVMRVKLAAQLLSNSVAKAIEFCDKQLNIKKIADSDATVRFIKMINDLFDILNTRNLKDFGYSAPLNARNASKVLELCTDAKKYLLSLTTKNLYKKTKKVKNEKRVVYESKKVPLYKCRANTGVVGLLVCISSLEYLYSTLIETKEMTFLTTYKLSQDHVELFFGKIRSLGGHNNNPNTRQFKAAYKKLLAHLELSKKFSGNCIPLENIPILNGESTTNINNSTRGLRHEEEDEENISKSFLENRKNLEAIEENYDRNCIHLAELLNGEQNEINKQIVGYISGFVVYHLLKKISCDDCRNHLLATEKEWFHKLVDHKDVGGLCYASKDVFLICTEAENKIRHFIKILVSGGKTIKRKFSGKMLTMEILRALLNIKLFANTDAHTHDEFHHIYDLTKAAVEKYIDVRLHYICKKENIEKKYTSKRQVFNKLNLFQGT